MKEVKLHIYSADVSTELEVPFVDAGIKAGFPSPCLDYVTESIDLNKELIRHQETTFLARVSGHSLMDVGICDGDLVVAYVDGDFTLKEFKMDKANQCAWLIPHNESYSPIKVTADNEFLIWGVLTHTIKKLHR